MGELTIELDALGEGDRYIDDRRSDGIMFMRNCY